jgi:hypothetical protein
VDKDDCSVKVNMHDRFICGLFNDTSSSSDYTALMISMINK